MTNNLVNPVTNTATGEYVADWLFNLDSAITNLVAAYVSGYQATTLTTAADTNGGNAIKAGLFRCQFRGRHQQQQSVHRRHDLGV